MISPKTVTSNIEIVKDSPLCPICQSPSRFERPAPGWGEWRRCTQCTLEFVDPLRLGHDPQALFESAYRGQVQVNAMDEFNRRLERRRVILTELKDPSLWFWTPAFEQVIAWVQAQVPPGGTVLELGCGLGFVLHALRQKGFQAVGLDVAETAVEINRKDGFKVWHGPIETLPSDWVVPDAIVSFFMLHHLENPAGFLRYIHNRWPATPFALAIYGQSTRKFPESMPPRTLTRWNAQALGTAFSQAGYAVDVKEHQSTGAEANYLSAIRRGTARLWNFAPAYRLVKRVQKAILPKLPGPAKRDAFAVVAFGTAPGLAGAPNTTARTDPTK